MRDLAEFLVKALVDHKEQVRVEEKNTAAQQPYVAENPRRFASGTEVRRPTQQNSVVIEISVAKDDMGKVIGKRGRTINAIRSLVKAAAIKENLLVEIELVEQ